MQRTINDPELGITADTVREFSAVTKATLQQDIAPLMQWIDIAKFEEADVRILAHRVVHKQRCSDPA